VKEARVGSLSWFAGVSWLLLSVAAHGAASVSFRVGDRVKWLQRPAWWAAWKGIALVNKCNKWALRCAVEAGAEE
jgi:hypothetical protein